MIGRCKNKAKGKRKALLSHCMKSSRKGAKAQRVRVSDVEYFNFISALQQRQEKTVKRQLLKQATRKN